MPVDCFTEMDVSIKITFEATRKAFRDFLESIQNPVVTTSQELNVETWQDEFGRLCMWAANIGAHQTGQSSLDFRLRDSLHIRQQIIKLLDQIPKTLLEVKDAVVESDDEDIESLGESQSEDEDPQTQTQQLRESVATTINCLFEMSMLVRKPAQRDHRMGSNKADVAYFEPFDRNHVRDKFPRADEWLIARLGQAITRRRQYLRYRERHAMKLRQGLDPGTIGHDDSEILSQTVATESQNLNVAIDDQRSESGYSITSYAPTLMGGGNITIPAPPKASKDGKAFECPYCYFIIAVQGSGSWNRHVFGDLQPYVCTEMECTSPNKLYTTRHEWLQHLMAVHHQEGPSGSSSTESAKDATCALCSAVLPDRKQLTRHLARHLQELSLFLLPSAAEDSDEESHHTESMSDESIVILWHTSSENNGSGEKKDSRHDWFKNYSDTSSVRWISKEPPLVKTKMEVEKKHEMENDEPSNDSNSGQLDEKKTRRSRTQLSQADAGLIAFLDSQGVNRSEIARRAGEGPLSSASQSEAEDIIRVEKERLTREIGQPPNLELLIEREKVRALESLKMKLAMEDNNTELSPENFKSSRTEEEEVAGQFLSLVPLVVRESSGEGPISGDSQPEDSDVRQKTQDSGYKKTKDELDMLSRARRKESNRAALKAYREQLTSRRKSKRHKKQSNKSDTKEAESASPHGIHPPTKVPEERKA